jgi:uncharacterized protein YeaO (DUF488 family)
VALQRIYDDPAGIAARVLVDRLWPRGVSRERAALDAWCREVAPSDDLRTWYGHRPELFAAFHDRYLEELTRSPRLEALASLRHFHQAGPLRLLTATKALDVSHAAVLRAILLGEH